MATRTASKSARTTNARRTGRPTNAERVARVQSQQSLLIDTAMAAASAAAKAALGIIDGGVTSIGVPQAAQNQNASNATGSASQSAPKVTSGRKTRQAPGRRVDQNSKMSQTKAFYDENLKAAKPLNRADFVRAAAEKFDYSQQTANTYVSNIEKMGGYKMERRGGASNSRKPAAKRVATAKAA